MWLTTDELNFVPNKPFRDVDSVTTSFPFHPVNLGRYDSMIAIVSFDDPSTSQTIWVDEYVAITPTGAGTLGTTGNYLPIGTAYYRKSNTTSATGSGSDTLSARAAVASTGLALIAISTGHVNYYIEIKGADLDAGYPYVGVAVSTLKTASTTIACTYVMKPRYPGKTMVTALS
jgi:hypothetical protein